MANVNWSSYRAVGFTCTFQQNVASFALARRIKELHPQIAILFGGANFDGPMGPAWMEAVPCIDFAINGEADYAFPALLRALCHGGDPLAIPGVIGRRDGRVSSVVPGIPLETLDELPVPEYREYFDRAEELGLLVRAPIREVDIPFESSRGCWWGEKATCRFCGLNGSTMAYRGKSPRRVLEELQVLARRHRSLAFSAADNILNPDFLRSVIAPLAASDSDYWIFYEIKASVGREELRLMRNAGIWALQPGIESLSTRLLHIMRKGMRASQNVNFLRWARYYGIELYWNVLLGFPGETEEDYAEQTRLVRRLAHLEPPGGSVRIGLERFSPYFEAPDRFPVRGGRARPEPGYTHTYPASVDLDRAAYHFSGELEGTLGNESYEPLLTALQAWHDRWERGDRPALTFWWSPGVLQIEDRRSALAPANYSFEDPLAAIYIACSDSPVSVSALRQRMPLRESEAAIEAALAEFCRTGLMMKDGSTYLALAIPGTRGR
jgi:ribosomal peptide maturation radical SAM protein 1